MTALNRLSSIFATNAYHGFFSRNEARAFRVSQDNVKARLGMYRR